ncbi:MAG TPA: hypothetical protein VIH81_13440 [Roseiarcus sp.]
MSGGPTLAEGGEAACDELVKKTETEPGTPFGVVGALAALKKANRPAFETLRMRLKKAGCRVTELDDLIAKANDEQRGRNPTQADILLDLAEAANLFHAPDEIGYADLEVDGHRETWPIRSRGFRRWLARRYFEELGGAPNSEAIASAINVIEAKAHRNPTVRTVHVRVGGLDEKLYLDLCDAAWRAVEVDKAGWRVVDRPAVRFRRSPDMRALPEPERDGSVEGLRKLLNIGADDDDDFVLAVAYLLACLRGRGPYPIMVVTGEQGTAKSTRSALLSGAVDPRRPALRALPRDERDLFVAARTRHVLAFDNVSGLRIWLSDALCRIASGSGYGTRQLYSDDEEVLFDGARPIILNGIEDIVERPDLAERSLFSTCAPIADENRLSEDEVWEAFAATHASVMGGLLDAVSTGLRNEAEIRPPKLPRMADFAQWAIACEPALGKDGDFLRAYHANIEAAVENVIEANPVSLAARRHMEGRPSWEGSASDLLKAMNDAADERTLKSEGWPKTPRALSNRLRRAASFLRKAGVDVRFERDPGGRERTRKIWLTNTRAPGAENRGIFASASSASSASSEPADGSNEITDIDRRDLSGVRTMRTQTADDADAAEIFASEPNQLKNKGFGRLDGSDAKIRPSPAPEKRGMPEEAGRRQPIANPSRAPYEVLGPARPGQRCSICDGSIGVKRIKQSGEEHVWHEACAKRRLATVARAAPELVVAAAREAGVVFQLAPDGDLFTLEWRGPVGPLINDAIRDNYEPILDLLRREAVHPHLGLRK